MSFKLGQTLATYAINQAMSSQPFNDFIQRSLKRHHSQDWGDCCKEDHQINNESLKMGMRLFSVYNIPNTLQLQNASDDKIWIITEADRSSTTILLPSGAP